MRRGRKNRSSKSVNGTGLATGLAIVTAVCVASVAFAPAHGVEILREGFSAGVIPPEWTVVNNTPGSGSLLPGQVWIGYATNYTNGSGPVAHSSASPGLPIRRTDTELWTPSLDFTVIDDAYLSFTANFQQVTIGGAQFLVQATADGGTNWTTLLDWSEDHGSTFSTPGEDVSLDLSGFAGEPDVRVRFRHSEGSPGGFYAQIDDVVVEGFLGDYVSVGVNQFKPPLLYVEQQIVYETFPTACLNLYTGFLPGYAGLDALDVQWNGDVVFSTARNAFVSFPGGSMFLRQGRIYRWRAADVVIVTEDGGLDLRTLDALDRVDGAEPSYVFSVARNQFARGSYLKQQNAYAWIPAQGTIVSIFDGEEWGLQSLDCVEVFPTEPEWIGFSVETNQAFQTATGPVYLEAHEMYVLDRSTETVWSVFLAPGLLSLDACSLGFGTD